MSAPITYFTFRAYGMIPYLQLGQDGLSARDGDAAGLLLLGVGNLSVVDDDGVPGSTAAVTEVPADALGKADAVVRGKDDEVIVDVVGLAPGAHYPVVVVWRMC